MAIIEERSIIGQKRKSSVVFTERRKRCVVFTEIEEKSWEEEESSEIVYLPDEIIETVLSKLPVNCLLRNKTVSKSWNTIISDPLFLKNYQGESSSSSNLQTVFLSHLLFNTDFDLVKFQDLNIREVQQLRSPPSCPYKMLCHCDGVLLLAHPYSKDFMLWNPAASESRPKSFVSQNNYSFNFKSVLSYGLCHDPGTVGVFKFVLIFINGYLVFSDKYKRGFCTWKEFEEATIRVPEVANRCGVSADEVVYWVTCREIIYFDPRDDKFKILPFSNFDDDDGLFYLTELRGSLCVYRNKGGDKTKVRILIKEKGRDNNSWKDLITIENVETPISSFEPKYFVEDKIFILLHTTTVLSGTLPASLLVIYNPFRKTFEEVQLSKFHDLVPYIHNPDILSSW